MGHFVGVYTDELPKLESIIGSGSAEHFASVLQKCGGKFNLDPATHNRIAAALKNIIADSYPSGTDELDNCYGYAFEFLCRTVARKWTVQEIYVADDLFPEIFGFVWGAVDNDEDVHLLDNANPFGIPEGEYGCVFWHRVLEYVKMSIRRLGDLDYDQIAKRNGTDYREEISEILKVLTEAEQTGQGVFVTWNE